MQFGVLGPLEVWATKERLVRVPEVKVRALLADLLAHNGQVVPADRLVEDLWGGSTLPANPVGSLQAKVSQLRRALDEAEPGSRELIVHRAPGYALKAPGKSVDADRFRTLVAQARTVEDPRAKATVLTDALALWRGPAFADFADEPFVQAAVAGLEEERLTAVEEHAEARLELGEHSMLIGELTTLVAAHPLRERLRVVQMRSLYRVGRSSEALDSYAELRRLLDQELGLTPGPAIETLQQAILRQDPGLQGTAGTPHSIPGTRPRTNLPAGVNSLLGRDEALVAVQQLVRDRRLVTLTGPGGVGKTRLATATARELDGEFPDGVWLVELAGLGGAERPAGPGPLAEHVMAVIGIREDSGAGAFAAQSPGGSVRRLVGALASRRLLLVLDNCEHVVDAVAELVSSLLEAAPYIKLMTTSQEGLRIPGETVWPVLPLSLPLPGSDTAALRRSSAVQLFAARAKAVDPSFALDAVTAAKVTDICRRLDGLPLALELAATRVRTLGVQELLDRLDDRFRILNSGYRGAPQRQQTLQATIDWSWSLLSAREQSLLRGLAVHAEGCTLEAVEDLCADTGVSGDEVLDILARLVDRSLVIRVDGPPVPRYRLLESVAAYAQRKTLGMGETAELARRHLRYYAELAERARPHLHGRDQRRWLQLLDAESANFQRALDEARRTGSAQWALRLANALTWYWFLRGRLGEGCRALATALGTEGEAPAAERAEARTWHTGLCMLLGDSGSEVEAPSVDRPERTVGRARAEWFLGFAEWSLGALTAGEQRMNSALTDFRALRDAWGVAAALSTRAALAMARGNLEAMRGNALEARGHFINLGDAWGQLKATEVLSVLAEINADYEQAAGLHREGLRIAESLELWSEVSRKLSGLGRIALLAERLTEADELHERALRLAVDQGNRPVEQFAELGLALGARRQGRLDAAEEHLRPWREWNRSRGAFTGLALVLAELGFVAEQRGDADAALSLHMDCLATARVTGDSRAVALALEGLAGAHSLAGRHTRAARLLGTAAQTRARSGAPLPPAERGDVERISARIRERLGEEAFRAGLEAGAAMDHESAADEEERFAPDPPRASR
ncbi:BTAD domain-containing putative transcriptional regulator [Streptomyces sp. AK02-01A]|uniref:BTAD domain-containing putative transcriptional regulator n=1 Tax=Streptomyces sp. AK02-01A TaxID=3028648 RepID=UPI0029B4D7FA|nr:BTAD domain-containing putative transcriptional regulator [Streptomyces sp. AK02-01A]MDX3853680.1 BTAD domain-containing putative transcriptional regulator [Streptomyces sp. AK02-01A]